MTTIGARTVAAASALRPLGLHLLVSRDEFVITPDPEDPAKAVLSCKSIEMVDAFIADHRRLPSPASVPTWNIAYDRPEPAGPRKPRTGDVVHYVSYGSPVRTDGTQAYTSQCRAAIATEVPEGVENPQTLGLCVLNPTGMFFDRTVPFHPGTFAGPEREATPGQPLPLITCDDLTFEGGTWHWAGDQ